MGRPRGRAQWGRATWLTRITDDRGRIGHATGGDRGVARRDRDVAVAGARAHQLRPPRRRRSGAPRLALDRIAPDRTAPERLARGRLARDAWPANAWPSTPGDPQEPTGAGDRSTAPASAGPPLWDEFARHPSSTSRRSARRSPRRMVTIAAVVLVAGISLAVALRGGSRATGTSSSPAFGTSTTSPDTTIPHVTTTAPPSRRSTPTTVPTRAAQAKFLQEVRADTALEAVPASPLVRAGSAACAVLQRGSSYDDAVDTSITDLVVYHATVIDGGAVVEAAVGSLCPQYADVGGGIGLQS